VQTNDHTDEEQLIASSNLLELSDLEVVVVELDTIRGADQENGKTTTGALIQRSNHDNF